jgi:transposase
MKKISTVAAKATKKDPHRFRKSRDVGCYLRLQPGRRNSGQSEPQMHISKEGDPYLRTLLVQGAHHILGPFGADSDLRRWGLKLAERGGRNVNERYCDITITIVPGSWPYKTGAGHEACLDVHS